MVICESGSYYLKLKIWLFIADFYDKKSYLHEILFPISNMGLSGEQFGVPITFIENFMGRNFNTWKSLDEPLVVGFHLILANPRNKKMYKIPLGLFLKFSMLLVVNSKRLFSFLSNLKDLISEVSIAPSSLDRTDFQFQPKKTLVRLSLTNHRPGTCPIELPYFKSEKEP